MKCVCLSTEDTQVQMHIVTSMMFATDKGKCKGIVQQVHILTAYIVKPVWQYKSHCSTGSNRMGHRNSQCFNKEGYLHTATGTSQGRRAEFLVGGGRLRNLQGLKNGWQEEIRPGVCLAESCIH